MKTFPQHLNTRLLLLVSVTLLASGALSGWITAKRQSSMLETALREQSSVIARNLAETSATFLVLGDYAGLEEYLIRSAELPDIVRLRVCESSGDLLADVERVSGTTPVARIGRGRIELPDGRQLISLTAAQMVIWRPVEAGRPLGWLKAEFSTERIRKAQTETLQNNLMFSLFWVGGCAVVMLLALSPVVRSLAALAAFARQLHAHKGEEISLHSNIIEIGELVSSLNYASKKIFSSELQLLNEREQLRVSEERYRMVFENSSVSIWEEDFSAVKAYLDELRKDGVKDIELHLAQYPEKVHACAELARIINVNRAALALHGAASKEELLAGLVSTFTAESFTTFRKELVCLWDGCTEMIHDAVVKTLAGEPRQVTVYFSVCPGHEMTCSRVIVSLIDITERKRVEKALRDNEETLKQREALLNESQRLGQIGSWDWDADTDIIWWSDEYCRLYGVDPAQPPPNYREHLKVYTPEGAQRLDNVVKRAMKLGEPYELDLELARPTESTRWIVARGEAKRDANGRICGLRGTAQNITERKRAEENVQKLNEDLEQRVEERTVDLLRKSEELGESQTTLMKIVKNLNEKTTELEAMNDKLKELDRLKSLFIASMSHELRTPLNSIIGFSSILLNEWSGPVTAEQRDNLATVLRSGKHLLSLINDVIDVSKIEAGKVEPFVEEFDISEVVEEAVQAFSDDIGKKGIILEVHTEQFLLRTDRRRVLQCLLNLLSNALKYTDQGRITIETVPSGHASLEVRVSDTGIGIKPEYLPRLFSPFFRIVSPQRAVVPGTGLGLYLSRKLAQEVLRGDILVSSTYGAGSMFMLTVPQLELSPVPR